MNAKIIRKDDWHRTNNDSRLKLVARAEGSDGPGNGYVEGYLAVWGAIEGDAFALQPGCFTKTIAERVAAGKVPLVLIHRINGADVRDVIGTVAEAREDETGLFARCAFASTDTAQNARQLVLDGAVKFFSAGADIIQANEILVNDGGPVAVEAYEVREARLVDAVLTAFPLDERAVITGARSHSPQAVSRPQALSPFGAEAMRLRATTQRLKAALAHVAARPNQTQTGV